jgi:hypothetical protein
MVDRFMACSSASSDLAATSMEGGKRQKKTALNVFALYFLR